MQGWMDGPSLSTFINSMIAHCLLLIQCINSGQQVSVARIDRGRRGTNSRTRAGGHRMHRYVHSLRKAGLLLDSGVSTSSGAAAAWSVFAGSGVSAKWKDSLLAWWKNAYVLHIGLATRLFSEGNGDKQQFLLQQHTTVGTCFGARMLHGYCQFMYV